MGFSFLISGGFLFLLAVVFSPISGGFFLLLAVGFSFPISGWVSFPISGGFLFLLAVGFFSY